MARSGHLEMRNPGPYYYFGPHLGLLHTWMDRQSGQVAKHP